MTIFDNLFPSNESRRRQSRSSLILNEIFHEKHGWSREETSSLSEFPVVASSIERGSINMKRKKKMVRRKATITKNSLKQKAPSLSLSTSYRAFSRRNAVVLTDSAILLPFDVLGNHQGFDEECCQENHQRQAIESNVQSTESCFASLCLSDTSA